MDEQVENIVAEGEEQGEERVVSEEEVPEEEAEQVKGGPNFALWMPSLWRHAD